MNVDSRLPFCKSAVSIQSPDVLPAQIADVTKAKAAVVNEKLEWEELDKQEQVIVFHMHSVSRMSPSN
jgi:hypothetical protein